MTSPNHLFSLALSGPKLIACGDDSASRPDAGGTPDAMVDDAAARLDLDPDTAVDMEVDPQDLGADTPDAAVPEDNGPPDMAVDSFVVECEAEGEVRAVPCGACGLRQETCEGGVWISGAECLAEGECMPGNIDEESTDRCGSRSRICRNECSWSEWTTTVPDRECVPDETRSVPGTCLTDWMQPQRCSPTCEWVDDGACTTPCGVLRSAPFGYEEVCIPAGPFIRGDETLLYSVPVTTVMMSTYAIDKYPVTYGRYRACRQAGACPGPFEHNEDRVLDDAYFDWIVGMSYIEAAIFCQWDGGRHVTTEAEFEKAARGPAPRDNPWPWEGTAYRCDVWEAEDACPNRGRYPHPGPIGSMTGGQSYYGVDDLVGRGSQWASDWFASDYYSSPASLVDPAGPASGPGRVVKTLYNSSGGQRIGRRSPRSPARTASAFRCARSVP